jgi:hypothetical protein
MAEGTRRVASKRALRVTAWASAAAAFAAAWGALGVLPKPIPPLAAAPAPQEVIVVRKILRRVIVQPAAPATPPVVTYAPAPSAPTGAPTTSTGGSAP